MNIYWIAGFWEGEGSCGVYIKKSQRDYYKPYYSKVLKVSCVQKEKYPLVLIQRYFKVGNIWTVKHSGCNKVKMYSWDCANKKAFYVLRKLQPYLRSPRRRKQVSLALRLYKEYQKG